MRASVGGHHIHRNPDPSAAHRMGYTNDRARRHGFAAVSD
jgi:hypothetical protein